MAMVKRNDVVCFDTMNGFVRSTVSVALSLKRCNSKLTVLLLRMIMETSAWVSLDTQRNKRPMSIMHYPRG